MAHYFGLVKGGVVLLPPEVSLADGTVVEIRVAEAVQVAGDERAIGDAAKRRLVALGLLTEIKGATLLPSADDRRLIEVEGKPLSETIIEERR